MHCARQNIGIREHRKINFTEETDNPYWPCHDVSEGNFIEMIKLLSVKNENFKTNFKSLPENDKYISPDVQNNLIRVALHQILHYTK